MATPTGARIRGVTIKGQLTADEDITLDCAFDGVLDLARHQLVMGPEARVSAAVTAHAVTIHGRLDGHVTADSVRVMSAATVDASIVAERFAIEEGARFTGPVNTERARAAGDIAKHRASQPASPRPQTA